jgi:hypothetical protein
LKSDWYIGRINGKFRYFIIMSYSRDSSVGIAMSYALGDWGSIARQDKIFLLHNVQTGSGAQPAGSPFAGGKVAEE